LRAFQGLLGVQEGDYSALEADFKAKEKDLTNKLNNNLRQNANAAVKMGLAVRFHDFDNFLIFRKFLGF
jgi:hypothetical protein